MESDKMYYVPNITELYCGYQCEIYKPHHPKLGAEGYWKEVKIGDIGQGTDIIPITKFRNLKKENRIRTKYLDVKDIESMGFEHLPKKSLKGLNERFYLNILENKTNSFHDIMDYYGYKAYHVFLSYYSDKSGIKIFYDFNGGKDEESSNTMFDGECKSINELNKILKLLKIK